MGVTILFWTSRAVNQLFLLKGGNSVGIVTDGIFGQKRKLVANLNDISFTQTRMARSPSIMFTCKGYRAFFSINRAEGKFHEKAVFDHVICQQRLKKT